MVHKLTLSVRRRRQPGDLICNRDGAGLEHPLVHDLLLQTLQLGLELVLVGLLADGVVRDRGGDLLAELMLFPEFVPGQVRGSLALLKHMMYNPREEGDNADVHSLVDLLEGKVAVDLRHRLPGLLHRVEGLLVDICRFDRVYLLF